MANTQTVARWALISSCLLFVFNVAGFAVVANVRDIPAFFPGLMAVTAIVNALLGLALLLWYSAEGIVGLYRDPPTWRHIRYLLGGAIVGGLTGWFSFVYGWVDAPINRKYDYVRVTHYADEFGCKALASATINDPVSLGDPNKYRGFVEASAYRGTDTLSLKIAGKKLLVMSGASHKIGATNAEEMDIISQDEKTVLAIQIVPNGSVFAVRLDRKAGTVVWGKVGTFLFGGAMGWVHYLVCH